MLSYLPLLPVLELLEGRAGVWELDTPADINETRNKTSMITSFSGYTLKLFNMYTALKQGKKRKKKKKKKKSVSFRSKAKNPKLLMPPKYPIDCM